MKVTHIVSEGERKTVNASRKLVEKCRALMNQEMMLDVAATVAATQPEIEATQTKPTGARAARP